MKVTREETDAIWTALEALEAQNENWSDTFRAMPSDRRDPLELECLREREHHARVLERLYRRAVAELDASSTPGGSP